MAQTVSKDDSPGRVETATRRHRRMTNRVNNAQAIEIARRIDEPHRVLIEKNAAVALAEQAVEDALDDWIADDNEVDDRIESVSRKSVDYDAEHAGAQTHWTLFRGRAPSDITYLPRDEQPDAVDRLIQHATALPPEHPALAILPALTEANDRARLSEDAHLRALTALHQARAAAEVAKLAVVKVYRDNVIDIGRAVGVALAERCFPRLRARRRKGEGGGGGQGGGTT